jgi:hypothetical protein
VIVRRLRAQRRRTIDLLARPPYRPRGFTGGWAAALVDPVAQLEELADLRRRGMVTPEEFELQVLRLWDAE